MLGTAGVTVIETNAAEVTVKLVEPLIAPELAVIVVCPVEALLAKPVLLMVATLELEETQVAILVMS
jgi:hypothetical protein